MYVLQDPPRLEAQLLVIVMSLWFHNLRHLLHAIGQPNNHLGRAHPHLMLDHLRMVALQLNLK